MASPSKSPNPAAGSSAGNAAPTDSSSTTTATATAAPTNPPQAPSSSTAPAATTSASTTEEVPRFDNDPDVDMAPAPATTTTTTADGEETEEPGIDGADKVADGAAASGSANKSSSDAMNVDSGPTDEREARIAALQAQIEAAGAVPVRKDMSMREFLSKMDDYAPIIPDAVTAHALTLAGLPPPALGTMKDGAGAAAGPSNGTGANANANANANPTGTTGGGADPHATPLHLSRLLALATQKFIADIAADAYQYSRMRSGNLTSNSLSAVSNPGAASVGQIGGDPPGGGGGGGGGGGAAAAAAAKNAADKGKQTGQHVLGVQRPGYGGGGQGGAAGRTVMTMEDLGASAANFGVSVKRSEFYR